MSNVDWDAITKLVDEHSYMEGVERTVERVTQTAEVFTPTALVIEMLSRLPLSILAPGKTVLDPACGDGQFLVAVKWLKVLYFGMTESAALGDIYGVDIMRDNVDLCLRRLGGGTILMGDTLHPEVRLEEQTEQEHLLMLRLYSTEDRQGTLFD